MTDNGRVALAEFLEARIAEDAARFDLPEFVLEESAHGHGWGNRGYCPLCDSYQFSGLESVTEEGWWSHAEDAHRMRQRLAECAAKRKIVQYAEGLRLDRSRDAETDAQYRAVWWVLWQLATPYASHPDYRQDWDL